MWRKVFEFLSGKQSQSIVPTIPVVKPPAGPGLPTTLPVEQAPSALKRPVIFDPALKHRQALRAGEPQFDSAQDAEQWQAERLSVMHNVLLRISDSPCANHLVLRGSTLMQAWFGSKARAPGDLDWVVTPATWTMNSRDGKTLIKDLIEKIQNSTISDNLRISAKAPAVEDIWTYEKAPGKRIVLLWENSQNEPRGTLQIDVVFGEPLSIPAQQTSIRLAHHPPITLMTASKELSLAWKLVWLLTDSYPMGKDLYDATLLSDVTRPTLENIRFAFSLHATKWYDPFKEFNPEAIRQLYLEWDDFLKEYPWIEDGAGVLKERLIKNLDYLWSQC